MADLRKWLAEVEAMGELKTLQGIHWDLEIGAIAELIGHQREKPAILFDDIPGYPSGHCVLINSLGSRNRFALTMSLPMGLTEMEMVQEWRRRSREAPLLPPRFVDAGPVMENAAFGEEVDVLKFPVPRWHELDGGRYIGTGDIVITQDPSSGWVNLGTYRSMVYDRNQVGLYISPTHHGAWHMNKWFAQGKSMPVAIVAGAEPLILFAAMTESPQGISEYDYAGAISGRPIEVIRGPITGLPIPAAAEIVLEGFVDLEERRSEGPFGEYTGYYGSGARPQPVVKVEGLYHRNNPIILGYPPLKPTEGQSYYRSLVTSAFLWDTLEAAGVPDVTGAWFHVVGGFLGVVAVRQRYPGHAKQAGRIASQSNIGGDTGRYIVVVDDDIDVTDIDEVLWAMCTRVDPDTDIEILRECASSPLDPIIPPERKLYPVASRAVIDATRPYEWRERFPEVVASGPELKQQVLARWGEVLQGMI
ncbi:MAG TPA: UbiD family decarboxylase [Dehalococcoidia bacterium]|nr:UbiD family decarboxylase [Dehalococcoidia bacterium]